MAKLKDILVNSFAYPFSGDKYLYIDNNGVIRVNAAEDISKQYTGNYLVSVNYLVDYVAAFGGSGGSLGPGGGGNFKKGDGINFSTPDLETGTITISIDSTYFSDSSKTGYGVITGVISNTLTGDATIQNNIKSIVSGYLSGISIDTNAEDTTTRAGKILKVNSSNNGFEWADETGSSTITLDNVTGSGTGIVISENGALSVDDSTTFLTTESNLTTILGVTDSDVADGTTRYLQATNSNGTISFSWTDIPDLSLSKVGTSDSNEHGAVVIIGSDGKLSASSTTYLTSPIGLTDVHGTSSDNGKVIVIGQDNSNNYILSASNTTYLTDGSSIDPSQISVDDATNGQVLKFNGNNVVWGDAGTTYSSTNKLDYNYISGVSNTNGLIKFTNGTIGVDPTTYLPSTQADVYNIVKNIIKQGAGSVSVGEGTNNTIIIGGGGTGGTTVHAEYTDIAGILKDSDSNTISGNGTNKIIVNAVPSWLSGADASGVISTVVKDSLADITITNDINGIVCGYLSSTNGLNELCAMISGNNLTAGVDTTNGKLTLDVSAGTDTDTVNSLIASYLTSTIDGEGSVLTIDSDHNLSWGTAGVNSDTVNGLIASYITGSTSGTVTGVVKGYLTGIAPTTNGTYILKYEKTNSTKSLSWVDSSTLGGGGATGDGTSITGTDSLSVSESWLSGQILTNLSTTVATPPSIANGSSKFLKIKRTNDLTGYEWGDDNIKYYYTDGTSLSGTTTFGLKSISGKLIASDGLTATTDLNSPYQTTVKINPTYHFVTGNIDSNVSLSSLHYNWNDNLQAIDDNEDTITPDYWTGGMTQEGYRKIRAAVMNLFTGGENEQMSGVDVNNIFYFDAPPAPDASVNGYGGIKFNTIQQGTIGNHNNGRGDDWDETPPSDEQYILQVSIDPEWLSSNNCCGYYAISATMEDLISNDYIQSLSNMNRPALLCGFYGPDAESSLVFYDNFVGTNEGKIGINKDWLSTSTSGGYKAIEYVVSMMGGGGGGGILPDTISIKSVNYGTESAPVFKLTVNQDWLSGTNGTAASTSGGAKSISSFLKNTSIGSGVITGLVSDHLKNLQTTATTGTYVLTCKRTSSSKSLIWVTSSTFGGSGGGGTGDGVSITGTTTLGVNPDWLSGFYNHPSQGGSAYHKPSGGYSAIVSLLSSRLSSQSMTITKYWYNDNSTTQVITGHSLDVNPAWLTGFYNNNTNSSTYYSVANADKYHVPSGGYKLLVFNLLSGSLLSSSASSLILTPRYHNELSTRAITGYSLTVNPSWLSTSTSGGYQAIRSTLTSMISNDELDLPAWLSGYRNTWTGNSPYQLPNNYDPELHQPSGGYKAIVMGLLSTQLSSSSLTLTKREKTVTLYGSNNEEETYTAITGYSYGVNPLWLSGQGTTGVSGGAQAIMQGTISAALSTTNSLTLSAKTKAGGVVTGYNLGVNPSWLSSSNGGGNKIIQNILSASTSRIGKYTGGLTSGTVTCNYTKGDYLTGANLNGSSYTFTVPIASFPAGKGMLVRVKCTATVGNTVAINFGGGPVCFLQGGGTTGNLYYLGFVRNSNGEYPATGVDFIGYKKITQGGTT